jgi:hypothetical protein
MKIALCLSGQPRGLPNSYNLLKENLIEPNNITDIFIHNWFDSNSIGRPFDSAQPSQSEKIGAWHEQTEEFLNRLKPKKIILEAPKSFSEFEKLTNLPHAVQTRLASAFYSAFICNKLKKEYEQENNLIYDIVIKTRIDINYHKKIIIENFLNNLNAIYVADMHHHMRINDSYPTQKSGFTYSSLGDTFALGSSKNIDIFTSIFESFKEIYHDIWPYAYGEAYQGYVVRGKYNIPIVSTTHIAYDIYRG